MVVFFCFSVLFLVSFFPSIHQPKTLRLTAQYLERLPVLQEQDSAKSVTFLFLEKTTICFNVSVPWVTWMLETSGLTAFRITLLVLVIEAQCLQVEGCLEQTNNDCSAADVH